MNSAKLIWVFLGVFLLSLGIARGHAYAGGDSFSLAALREEAIVNAFQEAENKLAAAHPPVEKGAWLVPKGELRCELYNKYYWNHSQYNAERKRVRWSYSGDGDEIRNELKLEYGFLDNLNLLLYLAYKEAHWRDDFKKNTKKAFVETWLGTKYQFLTNPFVTTLQWRLKIPGNYNENDVPSLGRKQIDSDIKLLLGKSLLPINAYTKLECGYRYRAQEPTDEFIYFYELGFNLTDSFVLKGTIDGVKGLPSTGEVLEDYVIGNLAGVFKFKEKYNLELGYGYTFAGKNTSEGREVVLKLSTTF